MTRSDLGRAVAPLVGAWIEIPDEWNYCINDVQVAPLVGAWIEITWNGTLSRRGEVAPLVGAWIEIIRTRPARYTGSPSLPLWERGLKWTITDEEIQTYRRSPCGSVD